MSSSTLRDVTAKPNQLLRSVMTTKSAVVDRLTSGLGQLANVVSAQLPEQHIRSFQPGDGQTHSRGRGQGRGSSVQSFVNAAMRDTGGTPTDADSLEMSLGRATFPPGKRRRSCIAGTTTSMMADKTESGKSEPGDSNISAGMDVAATRERMIKSLDYSGSFDLGMTQPGSLDTWRSNSEKARLSSQHEAGQQRVSDTTSNAPGHCGIDDWPGTTTPGGNVQPTESQHLTAGVTGDVVCKTQQEVEDSPTYHRNYQQQQQQESVSLQQSRQKFNILTTAAWCKSSRRARRRWSDMVALPDTPP